MTFIKASYDFAKQWNDQESINRFATSKSKDVQIAEAENILRDMTFRFERSPNPTVIKMWASDIIKAGYTDAMLKQVCVSIPFKFERFPSLSDLMALLRPLMAVNLDSTRDELTDLSMRCYPHLKAKFLRLTGQEVLDKMCLYYAKEILPYPVEAKGVLEQCVLNDWLRTYFSSDPKRIIEQGKISSLNAEKGDILYFTAPLQRYAKEHDL